MMDELFGIDIAGILFEAFDGQLKTGTLQRGSENYEFQGFMEVKVGRRPGTAVVKSNPTLTIIGRSISVTPAVGDFVTFEGVRNRKMIELMNRDPAGATYTFLLED